MARVGEHTSLIVVKEGDKNHIKVYYSRKGVSRFKTNVYVKDKSTFLKDNELRKSNAINPLSFQDDKKKIYDFQLKIEEIIEEFEKEHLQKPTKVQLDSLLLNYKDKKQRVYTFIGDYLSEYALTYQKKDERNEKSLYLAFSSALFQFFTYKNRKYYFTEINRKFIEEFIDYLLFLKPKRESNSQAGETPLHELGKSVKFDARFGMNNNTLLKRIDTFRSFIIWAMREKHVSLDYPKIIESFKSVIKEKNIGEYSNIEFAFRRMVDVRKLGSEEFESMIKDASYQELNNGSIKERGVGRDILIRAKDFFLISILTGNRLSDLKAIKEHHVFLGKQTAKKTKNQFLLNSNASAIQLLEKHKYDIKMPDSKYNKCIKVVMKQFYHNLLKEKDKMVVQIERRGNHEQVEYVEYYTLASSHSGRRSFATIAYHESGKTKRAIMQFTGHTSEKEFDKYIQLEPEQDKEDFATLMTL
ncbi:hypothetical protein TH61_16200 [Rufibacter sp. DG15C]|uniref:phage integrase SAM-like domain-containing protein n=1 Tax=Rufibacter sp. DG15C TaxID=1379909 RepID=UPI00078B7254|nr:phage integrase SAM-like domain-containing protein [Rufibacter sp. DG15C]AMM52420.1 hypothetical protein TH61_16200 [Rufibacter sp. DG15C]